ncbi:hypothetical protein [Treponema sp. OMZ 906]|uniref:hypothetical protein n=1 Tax=Treponema sp. OMZ 906 TaxID=2563662 RepID=UPI0020A4CAE1|nr:hypothetical protein [Treponema sp. OMZ 906]UTC55138.1 hypothetical protein E4N69_10350 [Treponema sp. OMZ 906]
MPKILHSFSKGKANISDGYIQCRKTMDQEDNLSVSLLKIGGADARSLAEIKRRRIGYTASIYFGVATTQMPAYF